MSKHKTIPKKIRQQVYAKYSGHCAYCGCKLDYKDMQVDHVNSIYLHDDYRHNISEEDLYDISNLMPACRACNFYKGPRSIEDFRKSLETTLFENTVKPFQFRLAEKYGLVERRPHKIRFFFEDYDTKNPSDKNA